MIGLACSTVSCDGFDDNQFARSLQIVPQVGFRYIEFNCWHPGDITPERIRQLKARSALAGITPIAVYGWGFGGSNISELSKDVAHKIRLIEAASEIGCRRIVATGARRGESGGLQAIITVLREIVPYAEEKNVLICLENHAHNNLETIGDYETIFREVPSEHVGLCVDTGHFEAAGVHLSDVVHHFTGRINHIHVKETVQFGVEQFVRFGCGVTDNQTFVQSMVDLGYQGYLSVELAIADKSNLLADLQVPYDLFHQFEEDGYERL